MILKKDMLTKSLKKGRPLAVEFLNKLAIAGGLPVPHFEYEPGGSVKRRSHYFKVRFRVPEFLASDMFVERNTIYGSGKATNKKYAKSLAALEVVHRLEESLEVERGKLQKRLDEYETQQREKKECIEAVPVEKEIPGVSWETLPLDPAFSETLPASRRGRIEFSPALMRNYNALTAAKAITLLCQENLPEMAIHANQTDSGVLQQWANVRVSGRIHGVSGPRDESLGMDKEGAEILALQNIHRQLGKHPRRDLVEMIEASGKDSSFGMAKLFVTLPKHQFKEIKDLLAQVEPKPLSLWTDVEKAPLAAYHHEANDVPEDMSRLKLRIATLRAHQKECPLPVDSIEPDIPHEASVTIVRGGTGSGKTTRYPLMLSLFSPSGPTTKVLVAQPRRLACQMAARRVAYEQGFALGSSKDCPIGYAIRFESFASTGDRTVDFQTPGVILRRAMDDPLLRDVSILVVDEVHERNADMDLLLALAKEALKQRSNHETLPPLRLVLMSATVDSSHWESYFRDDYEKQEVVTVDVPATRRFPIDIVHLDEKAFPKKLSSIRSLQQARDRQMVVDLDEAICKATAELASSLIKKNENGSILCFLPGMEEIRLVDRLLRQQSRGKRRYTVRYLHSSLSAAEQAKVFLPGSKIILSTNLAETSVTIPDVKIVIDGGRERQHSLLESSSTSDTTTVVGSQLATVNISQASAKQRAGRAGRVSAGMCYRLYSRAQLESQFAPFTLPEMLRMDLSQLVLHSLSLYHPSSGHPLHLLLTAPDPPTELRLTQTLRGLANQGLVHFEGPEKFFEVSLTSLGLAVNSLPAVPRLGRMLFVGLVLRAIEPALRIVALLSVPKVCSQIQSDKVWGPHCSDIVKVLEEYRIYVKQGYNAESDDPRWKLFAQVRRVERQLEQSMKDFLAITKGQASRDGEAMEWSLWNQNSDRVAALSGLICAATPHIAHLVQGRSGFSTRDVAAKAKMHPSSVNFGNNRRVHWYVYHELRTTKAPYLHVTMAASPLELALFAEASGLEIEEYEDADFFEGQIDIQQEHDEWLFIVDQWVPVEVSNKSQRETFVKLRRFLMHDMLQQAAEDPNAVVRDPVFERIVLFVLSALEQQRLSK